MKIRHLLILAIVLAGVSFTSCEKLEEAKEFSFNATFEGYLDVYVPPVRTDSIYFSAFADIDPTSHEQLMENLENIESIEVVGLSAVIDTLSQDVTVHWATLKIYSGEYLAQWDFYNLPLTIGTPLVLDNANGQWNTINTMMSNPQMYFIELEGEADEGDVYIGVLVENEYSISGSL